MLHSRWQLAVSDKPIPVNSNLTGCYAVAAASTLAARASGAANEGGYGTPSLRQDGLHVGIMLATVNVHDSFGAPWMKIRGENKLSAASRSQAPVGLREGGG